jgi:hypothetical protein
LRQLEYGILSQRTVKKLSKKKKNEHFFLKPLLLTGENNLINRAFLPVFTGLK